MIEETEDIEPVFFSFHIIKLRGKLASFKTNDEIVNWVKKALDDLSSCCASCDVDTIVKKTYEEAKKRMVNDRARKRKYQEKKKAEKEQAQFGNPEQPQATSKEEDIPYYVESNDNIGEPPEGFESPPIDLECNDEVQVEGELFPVEKKPEKKEKQVPEKHAVGEYGHVMLTDEEVRHLREVYGEDLKIAIEILDSYIENGGKMAKKYKSHSSVMRKFNWVWKEVQSIKLSQKRLENANRRPTNWKAEERERTARMLRGEDMDGKNYVRDEDLTPEELERKYGQQSR